jgi:hypothetical protein
MSFTKKNTKMLHPSKMIVEGDLVAMWEKEGEKETTVM